MRVSKNKHRPTQEGPLLSASAQGEAREMHEISSRAGGRTAKARPSVHIEDDSNSQSELCKPIKTGKHSLFTRVVGSQHYPDGFT